MSTAIRYFLVVNGRGDCRLVRRRPTLAWDEIAFPLDVTIPGGWSQIYDDRAILLTLPSPPEIPAPVIGEPAQDTPGAA